MYHYKEKKKKGFATLAKVGDGFFLTVSKFNPETGEKQEPSTFKLDKENIKERKADLEKQAEDLGVLLKDMEAL